MNAEIAALETALKPICNFFDGFELSDGKLTLGGDKYSRTSLHFGNGGEVLRNFKTKLPDLLSEAGNRQLAQEWNDVTDFFEKVGRRYEQSMYDFVVELLNFINSTKVNEEEMIEASRSAKAKADDLLNRLGIE